MGSEEGWMMVFVVISFWEFLTSYNRSPIFLCLFSHGFLSLGRRFYFFSWGSSSFASAMSPTLPFRNIFKALKFKTLIPLSSSKTRDLIVLLFLSAYLIFCLDFSFWNMLSNYGVIEGYASWLTIGNVHCYW